MKELYDEKTHVTLRAHFESGVTRPVGWRMGQLAGLDAFLREQERAIAEAVRADFRKPAIETFLTETGYLRGEICYVRKRLARWMKRVRVPVPLIYQPAGASCLREPLGVVLILGAWNYPLQLCLAPLIGAIAGGNCAVLKPSEMAPATSRLIASELPGYLDRDAFRICEGGAEQAEALLVQRFDHIFFTGSVQNGKLVMEAAAKQLTPVTLEMGGKCPCIVTAGADLQVAARRIVWAKFLNAGQTCIAPDYVLVQESVVEELLALMRAAIIRFYGHDPKNSPAYPRIIDDRHFMRLRSYLQEGSAVTGGVTDEAERYIAPTIVRDVPQDAPLLHEEIFGPVLPVMTFTTLDQATATVRSNGESLVVYLFSREARELDFIGEHTRSGAVCRNDLMFHAAVYGLPFGGIGRSGMGRYHGKAGFETFTFSRSTFVRSTWPDPLLRYPPYSRGGSFLLKLAMRLFA